MPRKVFFYFASGNRFRGKGAVKGADGPDAGVVGGEELHAGHAGKGKGADEKGQGKEKGKGEGADGPDAGCASGAERHAGKGKGKGKGKEKGKGDGAEHPAAGGADGAALFLFLFFLLCFFFCFACCFFFFSFLFLVLGRFLVLGVRPGPLCSVFLPRLLGRRAGRPFRRGGV